MRETRPSGSEGGGTQTNESSLPLSVRSMLPWTSDVGMDRQGARPGVRSFGLAPGLSPATSSEYRGFLATESMCIVRNLMTRVVRPDSAHGPGRWPIDGRTGAGQQSTAHTSQFGPYWPIASFG